MRLFEEPDHTGFGATYHSRLYVLNADSGGQGDCSSVDDSIARLIGCLPGRWMETPLGWSPGRTVAEVRRRRRRS